MRKEKMPYYRRVQIQEIIKKSDMVDGLRISRKFPNIPTYKITRGLFIPSSVAAATDVPDVSHREK